MVELDYDLGSHKIGSSSVKMTFIPYLQTSANVSWLLPDTRKFTESFDPRNPGTNPALPDGRYKVGW